MSRPPVVVIATRVYRPEVAAAAFRLRQLALALGREGARVVVVTSRPPRELAVHDDPEVHVRRAPVLRDQAGVVRGQAQYLSFDVPLVARLMFGPRPRLIVAEPPPTTGLAVQLACLLRRSRYAWYAADLWSEAAGAAGASSAVVRLLRSAERRVLHGSCLVLAVSDEVAAKVTDLGVPHERVHVVGNGVDTEIFTLSGPSVHDLVGADHEPVPDDYVVYAGTMSQWQGADVFVRALSRAATRLPDCTLVFLGQGADEPALRRLAGQVAPGRVRFLGVRPPEEAAAWLRGARAALVSISPTVGYDFAKPTKIYAAAACGTPVLFAGPGAGAELVRSARLGWVADHEPDSVARSLVEIFTSPAASHTERARLGAWAEREASLQARARVAAHRLMSDSLLPGG